VGRISIDLDGEAARQRVLQFRTDGAGPLDTRLYQRRAFVNRLTSMVAALADPERYLRLGSMVQLRREELAPYYGNDSARGGIGKLFTLGRLPINGSVQAYYNVVKADGGPDWSTRVQVQLLFPK